MTSAGTRLLPHDETKTLLWAPAVDTSEHEALADLVAIADETYAAQGWGQDAYRLLAVARLADLPQASRARLTQKARTEGVSLTPATALTVTHMSVGGGEPLIELIGGCRVPEWAGALILTEEAWAAPAPSGEAMDPASGLPPSEHPGRVAGRATIAVARDGYMLGLMTARSGGEATLSVGDASAHSYGRTVDLLLRLMGAPTAPSAYHPEHLLAAVVLGALPEAAPPHHEMGTPGVRDLAHALAAYGTGSDDDDANYQRAAAALAVTNERAAAFVEKVDPAGAALLVDAVRAADHPDGHTSLYTPGAWDDAAAQWAEWAAESDDDTWMDSGMFAREAFAENTGGHTDEDLLSTIAVVFGEADAALLRTGLTVIGALGWPAWDMTAPTPVESP